MLGRMRSGRIGKLEELKRLLLAKTEDGVRETDELPSWMTDDGLYQQDGWMAHSARYPKVHDLPVPASASATV